MRFRYFFIVLMCSLALGLAGTTRPAMATSCSFYEGTPEEMKKLCEGAREVFAGTVVSQTLLHQSSVPPYDIYELKIKVLKVWKGANVRTKYIQHEGSMASKIGIKQVFFPYSKGGVLTIGMCDVVQTYYPKFFDPKLELWLEKPAIADPTWPEQLSTAEENRKELGILAGIVILGGVGSLVHVFLKRAKQN